MIFDTHSHYDDEAFDNDRDELLSGMPAKNVGNIVCVGASWDSLNKIQDITSKYPFTYAALGIHPENALELTEARKIELRDIIISRHPVAIGEIGLDYHYDEPSPEIQKDIFIYQLELAKELDLPVIIHSRDATEDTLEIVKAHCPKRKGVVHCFSSSFEIAVEYINMGFYIGIGGVVTFKNGKKLKDIAARIPLSSILLETDCPYMAPVPHRGERNDSSLIDYVAKEIATLRGITKEEVIKATEENAFHFFNITRS